MPEKPVVYSIEPNVPFLDALATGLLERHGDQELGLSDVRVFLPNRRACRGLMEAFLRQSDGRALLLPNLVPLGEIEQSEEAFISEDETALHGSLDILPPISGFQRLFALSRLIVEAEKKHHGEVLPLSRAVRLASSLILLLDEVETEQLDFSNLADLVESDYAVHWQITLKFLEILSQEWPRILTILGCEDPANRRNMLAAELVENWKNTPPFGPVYAAGSTGSIPATSSILVAIAHLPRGAVILPGFDLAMNKHERANLPITHPQFGMTRLIDRIGVKTSNIKRWSTAESPVCSLDRVLLIRAATAPPDLGIDKKTSINLTKALSNVSFITCPSPQEEAGVIALALREVLETPGRTGALVTPDRTLARRVASELRRWGVVIDDSAGQPLSRTPIGTYLYLSAVCFANQLAPVHLLSFLKHPLSTNGFDPASFRKYVRMLEVKVFRGPRPAPGFVGIRAVLRRLVERDNRGTQELRGFNEWFDRLRLVSAGLEELFSSSKKTPLIALIDKHINFIEQFSATPGKSGPETLWVGEDGEATASFISELRDAAKSFPEVKPKDYPVLLEALMKSKTVRPRFGIHPRLHIWGLLEARLQRADLMCLGGLNETVWPSELGADPWMSRPMRQAFGLPSGDRRIGLSAHDFVQGFCSEQVLITRAERVEGTPTVPARWLLRLDNVLKSENKAAKFLNKSSIGGENFLAWQASLDRPHSIRPCKAPTPRPPVSARPRQLSATQIETWMRDPYAIYARYILNLRPLDQIDANPSMADRGTMIHEALERFVNDHPDKMPTDVLKVFHEIGIDVFGDSLAYPSVWAFWWPRYERIVDWFVSNEANYRKSIKETHTEVTGELNILSDYGKFKLIAKADRVDELLDGTISIVDYKTGIPPSASDIFHGFAPQLPLEAAIAAAGGFEDISGAPVSLLEVWRINGGDPAGERRPAGKDIDELSKVALKGLTDLVKKFDDPETPYLSHPNPMHAPGWSDYTHLARVLEWSSVEGGDE